MFVRLIEGSTSSVGGTSSVNTVVVDLYAPSNWLTALWRRSPPFVQSQNGSGQNCYQKQYKLLLCWLYSVFLQMIWFCCLHHAAISKSRWSGSRVNGKRLVWGSEPPIWGHVSQSEKSGEPSLGQGGDSFSREGIQESEGLGYEWWKTGVGDGESESSSLIFQLSQKVKLWI